jgi:eukaryotic-like serine/threonine-protein kinase
VIIMGEVRAGHTLGRYELLVPIALGGMASVWAARTTGPFPKIVAVKLLRAELSDDPDFEAMFLDEATLVSQIHHPNVAETLDAGEEDGVLYQVMELIDGEPLNLIMRESKSCGGLPLPIALRIVSEVCLGLHVAHELRGRDGNLVGLVHRDVSPQNILVAYDGAVKLVDFGVAKAASNLQRTKVGQLKGKYAYMAPEQASSQPVDRRSDVFTLGIVFYQLVTGKHPFLADNEPATILRIANKNPAEPPRTHAPSLPQEVERIIMKALAKPKEERFATMADMRTAIEQMQPAQRLAGTDEVAALMSRLLGPRGERRRAAIQEAIQIVDHSHGELDSRAPPPAVRQPPPPAAQPAARTAVASAQPPRARPQPPPMRRRVAPAAAPRRRRLRLAPIAVICLALGFAFAHLFLSSIDDDAERGGTRAPAAGTQARSLKQPVLRAAAAAVRAARARAPADPVKPAPSR